MDNGISLSLIIKNKIGLFLCFYQERVSFMKIRRATEKDLIGIAQVHVETWQSTYKGIIPEDYLQSLTIENRLKNWQRHLKTLHTATFIAENEAGAVIGFAIGGPEQTSHPLYQAEIYAIYILDTYQRNGVGKQLIKPIAKLFEEKKYPNMIIWALEENSNHLFYQSLGGQIVASKNISINGKVLKEIGYGWDSIHDLLIHL